MRWHELSHSTVREEFSQLRLSAELPARPRTRAARVLSVDVTYKMQRALADPCLLPDLRPSLSGVLSSEQRLSHASP